MIFLYSFQDSDSSAGGENTEELERRLRERALKSMKRGERATSADSK